MITKILELRDEGTFIPALAIKVSGEDGYLARRAGYGGPCVLFGHLNGGEFRYDPHSWNSNKYGTRTWQVAHQYVIQHFDELKNGEVVDVSFILGETDKAKESELIEMLKEKSK
jgi:hypothetical protein